MFGIQRAKKFIRSASNNYRQQAYVLKLDIQGYFMHIRQRVVYDKVMAMLDRGKIYNGVSFEIIDYLLQQTIFNDVTNNCRIKGSQKDWQGFQRTSHYLEMLKVWVCRLAV